MRALTILVIFTFAIAHVSRPDPQRSSEDEPAVRKVMADFVDAVNRHDSKAFGPLLAEDAEFVVVTGKYLNGRNEIHTYHAGIWASDTDFKASRLVWNPLNVRFLRPDVAVAHIAARRTSDEGKELRGMFLTLVLTKQDNQWLLAALQNTLASGSV